MVIDKLTPKVSKLYSVRRRPAPSPGACCPAVNTPAQSAGPPALAGGPRCLLLSCGLLWSLLRGTPFHASPCLFREQTAHGLCLPVDGLFISYLFVCVLSVLPRSLCCDPLVSVPSLGSRCTSSFLRLTFDAGSSFLKRKITVHCLCDNPQIFALLLLF